MLASPTGVVVKPPNVCSSHEIKLNALPFQYSACVIAVDGNLVAALGLKIIGSVFSNFEPLTWPSQASIPHFRVFFMIGISKELPFALISIGVSSSGSSQSSRPDLLSIVNVAKTFVV